MKYLIAAASAAVALAFAGAAGAATFVYTYSGKITAGKDAQSVFGPGSTDLAGEAFTITFAVDDSLGTRTVGPIWSKVVGGTSYGTSSPASVRILVRGVEITIDGAKWSEAGASYSPTHQIASQVVSGSASGAAGITSGLVQSSVHAIDRNWLNSADYRDIVSSGPTPGSYMGGSFYVHNGVNPEYAAQFNFDAHLFLVDGVMPSSVPEPATWAMMIVGFGLAGTALRRRRDPREVSASV